jgi:ferredoxin
MYRFSTRLISVNISARIPQIAYCDRTLILDSIRTMKISIDISRCAGHGRCYALAPNLIDADDEGRGVADGAVVASEFQAQARDAAANCPESAVAITT